MKTKNNQKIKNLQKQITYHCENCERNYELTEKYYSAKKLVDYSDLIVKCACQNKWDKIKHEHYQKEIMGNLAQENKEE